MLVVAEAHKIIARPVEIVRAQFSDLAHHEKNRVHAALRFSDVKATDEGCRGTTKRRVLGRVQVDHVELARRPDGSSTVRSVSGANAGLVISQSFVALGPDRTRATVRVELPVRGLLRWLAPLLRLGLKRDLEVALEEDRVDLEVRGYPRTAS